MRILLLTSRLPYPPDRGDRLRVFNFIKKMAEQHELFLISFISKDSEKQHLSQLEKYCRYIRLIPKTRLASLISVGLNLWRSEPLQVLYYRSRELHKAVRSHIKEWEIDVVYTHLFRMAPYTAGLTNIYRILDLTDAISLEIGRSLPYRGYFSRLLYIQEFQRIKRYEQAVSSQFDECWLISQNDADELSSGNTKQNFVVIRNGVDINIFHPLQGVEEPDTIAFVGHLGVFHNIDAAKFLTQEIFPVIEREIPGVRLEIIGAEPVEEITAMQIPNKILIPGFVSDLNLALNRAAIFIAPLRFAAGVQNKVLEAMAAGRAVITSSMVAEGIKAISGRDLVVADTPQQFSAAAVDLLKHPSRRNAIGVQARKFVENHFSWDAVNQRLDVIHPIVDQKSKLRKEGTS